MRSRWFRAVVASVMLAAVLGVSAVAGAQMSSPEDTLVDVSLQEAEISTAITMLTQRTGIQFIFEPTSLRHIGRNLVSVVW